MPRVEEFLVLSPTIIVKAHTRFSIVERVISFLAERNQTFPSLIVHLIFLPVKRLAYKSLCNMIHATLGATLISKEGL